MNGRVRACGNGDGAGVDTIVEAQSTRGRQSIGEPAPEGRLGPDIWSLVHGPAAGALLLRPDGSGPARTMGIRCLAPGRSPRGVPRRPPRRPGSSPGAAGGSDGSVRGSSFSPSRSYSQLVEATSDDAQIRDRTGPRNALERPQCRDPPPETLRSEGGAETSTFGVAPWSWTPPATPARADGAAVPQVEGGHHRGEGRNPGSGRRSPRRLQRRCPGGRHGPPGPFPSTPIRTGRRGPPTVNRRYSKAVPCGSSTRQDMVSSKSATGVAPAPG